MEALVVMAIISIFFAAASKIITTKPKPPKQVNSHGYYECYVNGGLNQRYVRDGIGTALQSVATCTFEPPGSIAFFNINTYGPVYHSSFEPNINNKLTISISGSSIKIDSDNGTLNLSNNSTENDVRMFLETLYSNSGIYNDGSIRQGVIISW